ncbi:MAG: hypothetical protein JXA52_07860 [Planctomycetes bacterium]|nr:hypothetical protein [Planctomycetota bacterium]
MAKIIQINDIVEGMIAAHDIMNNDGHVLLAGGTRLTPNHINLLRKREVESLLIREPGEELVEIDEELAKVEENSNSVVIRRAQERIQKVFAKVREDELMGKLFSLALSRAAEITLTPEGNGDG